jgi:hypothetical protein
MTAEKNIPSFITADENVREEEIVIPVESV